MKRTILAVVASAAFAACAALTLAEKESPACAGVTLGGALDADVQFIVNLVGGIGGIVAAPTSASVIAVLDLFAAAKGEAVFQCEFEIAENLWHDANNSPAAAVPDAGIIEPLAAAVAMNRSAAPGALESLTLYRAHRINIGKPLPQRKTP